MPPKALDTETRYRLLKLLAQNPELSQRELAAELGVSLGKANYCLRAVIDRGWIKMVNFGNSRNKTGYFYRLTPKGVVEKTKAARRFLDRKLAEHERITADIEVLRCEMRTAKEEGGAAGDQ